MTNKKNVRYVSFSNCKDCQDQHNVPVRSCLTAASVHIVLNLGAIVEVPSTNDVLDFGSCGCWPELRNLTGGQDKMRIGLHQAVIGLFVMAWFLSVLISCADGG